MRTGFNETKREFKTAIRAILEDNSNYALKEAALPAYNHSNPLIDYIFWSRLRLAGQLALAEKGPVLDFGCGTGVMSYHLASNGMNVIAVDTEFEPLKRVQERITFPTAIQWHNTPLEEVGIKPGSIHVILALDVLEHIADLDAYALLFDRLLAPDGIIIVSGPTENLLYRVGRRLAGKQFSGEYHVTNIASIKTLFKKHFNVQTAARLIWPFTLFEIFTATKRCE